jgi:hypothetical protein
MGNFYPRGSWTDYWPQSFRSLPLPSQELFIHHTGGDGPGAFDAQFMRNTEHYEMTRPNDPLDAIAYHRVIFANGDRAEGRPWEVMGAATFEWNNRSIAICAVGNFFNYDPTNECIDAIVLEAQWAIAHGILTPHPNIHVRGHRDVNATGCPGDGLQNRVGEIYDRLGGATPGPAPQHPINDGILRRGSTGPQVKQWQHLLNTFNHAGLNEDSDFGVLTETATKNFQAIMHIDVDGIVGPQTRKAMADLINFLKNPPDHDKG